MALLLLLLLLLCLYIQYFLLKKIYLSDDSFVACATKFPLGGPDYWIISDQPSHHIFRIIEGPLYSIPTLT
jgi:hypothetical protein